jgi:hypothetical protein
MPLKSQGALRQIDASGILTLSARGKSIKNIIFRIGSLT